MQNTIKNMLPLFLLAFGSVSALAQQIVAGTDQILKSPDGNYEFRVYQRETGPENRQLYYTLNYKGQPVVEESELGVLIENKLFESALGIPNDSCHKWTDNLQLTDVDRTATDTTWNPLYGERSVIRDQHNAMSMKFQKGAGNRGEVKGAYDKRKVYFMDFEVRAYDQGIAFRYHFPEAVNGLFLHVTGEQTAFSFAPGTQAYHAQWAQSHYDLLPLEAWSAEAERPLTLKLANGLYVALAEANLVDYVRTKYKLADHKPNTLQASMYDCADIITPYDTPWRVIMAAGKPVDLINNNDLILNLNPACALEKTDWIKPGKVIRACRLTQADVLKYIDFAAARNLDYIHLDSGWYGVEMQVASDATTVDEKRDLDIRAICDYGRSKGVGLWVYVNQRALINQLPQMLPLYKEWGIKGIKFGFVQIGNQRWTTWLHEAVALCAEHEIMVDIHDEYRPTGVSRTYPNLLTQEGIRGNEEMPDATHNTILPFTRFLAGAGDYTVCYYNNRIKTTHAHQLALSVICYSPLQYLYWYDNPDQYQGEPEVEFFDRVKTVWDDTRNLDGMPGEYIVTARRSGDEWFVGAIAGNEGRKVSIPTDFLQKGKKYALKVFADDDKSPTKTKVSVSSRVIKGGKALDFDLKPSGGVALIITEL